MEQHASVHKIMRESIQCKIARFLHYSVSLHMFLTLRFLIKFIIRLRKDPSFSPNYSSALRIYHDVSRVNRNIESFRHCT